MGIACKGPDVNESFRKFSVSHIGDVRFGLAGIKGLGDNAVQSIIDEREKMVSSKTYMISLKE